MIAELLRDHHLYGTVTLEKGTVVQVIEEANEDELIVYSDDVDWQFEIRKTEVKIIQN